MTKSEAHTHTYATKMICKFAVVNINIVVKSWPIEVLPQMAWFTVKLSVY